MPRTPLGFPWLTPMPPLDPSLRALNRDRSNAWDDRTARGAPHKPLVLLALCDLADRNLLPTTLVPFDGPAFEALGRAFQAHWRKLFPDTRGGLWMPLWHLRSDGFWHPQPRSPHSPPPAAPNCMANLRERFAGARIDDELWQRLQAPQPREELRALLLARYFDAPTRELLAQSIRWNRAAERYADQLTDPAPGTPLPLDTEPVRSQGFRIAVLRAYEHRCGACGLRLQTPDGQSAVQAAHIKPWSQFHDDRIANGLALCPTCHWCFDGFLWTARTPAAIQVSRVVSWERNLPTHLALLDGQPLAVPTHEPHRPDPESLGWHHDRWKANDTG